MKINDAYLCVQTDCDEVFSYKEQHYLYFSYPFCPICGCKNVINLAHILNRKEVKNEDPIKGVRTIMLDSDGVGSYDATIKPHTTGEVLKTNTSDSPKDADLGVPEIPSDLSSICGPEDQFGTRLPCSTNLHGK